MFSVLMQMAQLGFIDESGIRDMLGLEEYDKDTMSKGAQGGPDPTRNKLSNWRQPVQINLWQDGMGKLNITAADWVKTDEWGKMEAHNKEKASEKKWTKAQQMKKWAEDTRG